MIAFINFLTDRTYAMNIGWVQISGNAIHDLLGVGNVHCASISDVFHWIQIGLQTLEAQNQGNDEGSSAVYSHTLFTLTLEQKWIQDGLIQHRLSTASFSDLCGTDRKMPQMTCADVGLRNLEQIVCTLTEPSLMYGLNGNIPYDQTTLTTLLKDSFGGRAQTLVILCVSPDLEDAAETICNLQFCFKVQCVRNYVIMNTFSDDNTPEMAGNAELPPALRAAADVGALNLPAVVAGDNFGLQFAAGQWFKLVSNAEGLFAK